jgi:hypothetical protein
MKQRSPQGTALTGLILETFRVNGLLLAAGDRLTSEFGLSSARTEFAENPDHRRAKLVSLTVAGRAVLEKINRRQIEWSNRLAEEQDPAEIEAALGVMQSFHRRLQAEKQ